MDRRKKKTSKAVMSLLFGGDRIIVEGDGLIQFYANGESLESLKVYFDPVQSGSGVPTPNNVRPITGWPGIYIYHSGVDTSDYDTIPVTWSDQGIIYGGYVDLITGELWAIWKGVVLDGSENWFATPGFVNRFSVTMPSLNGATNTVSEHIANFLNSTQWGVTNYTFGLRIGGVIYVTLDNTAEQMSVPEYCTYLNNNNLQIVFKLGVPILVTTLTPSTLDLFVGENNIWSNTGGHIEAEYEAR